MDRKSRSTRLQEESGEELSLWKQICFQLKKLEEIQKDETIVLNNINNDQLSIDHEKGITSSLIYKKLRDGYRQGIELSSSEIKTIQDMIEKINVLVALRENEQDQKRKKRRLEIDQNSSQIIAEGHTVAAKQPKSEEWILAIVLHYYPDKNKYQVEDVDVDDFGEKQRYMLPPRYVIPLLSSEKAKLSPEISAHKEVLALYPGTTCFYKATVITPPSSSKNKEYKVLFEDDNDQVKSISPEHVLEMPKIK